MAWPDHGDQTRFGVHGRHGLRGDGGCWVGSNCRPRVRRIPRTTEGSLSRRRADRAAPLACSADKASSSRGLCRACGSSSPTCARGIEVGEVQVFESSGPRPARGDDELNNTGFVFFSDPDGNGWRYRSPLAASSSAEQAGPEIYETEGHRSNPDVSSQVVGRASASAGASATWRPNGATSLI